MNEQTVSKTDTTSSPPAAAPGGKSATAARWIVFLAALFCCTALGIFGSIVTEGEFTRKGLYLPLGCLLSGVLGWMILACLKPSGNRWQMAIYWAGFAIIGFATSEVIAFGSFSDQTARNLAAWGIMGGFLGLLTYAPQRTPKS